MKFKALLRYLASEPVQVSSGEQLRSALAAFVALLVIGSISYAYFDHHALPWLAAPMGASAVILFALPSSPLAQPWPFAASHLTAATVGVACLLLIGDPVWAAAVALSLSILFMFLAHAMHPPGGASALLPIITAEYLHEVDFSFVLYPVGLNVGLMVIMAVVLNRWVLGRRYPVPPFVPPDTPQQHSTPHGETRGISYDDLHSALIEMDVYLDVNEEQLTQIYKRAGLHAMRRRMGEMSCAQIMTRDVVVIARTETLDKAWALLQHHRLRVLPVVDSERTVVGIISALDVLRGFNRHRLLTEELGLWQRLGHLVNLRRRNTLRVEDVMTEQVVTVTQSAHIADIVSLLSEGSYYQLPVVDERQRLVGIITQAELIATLYAGLVAA